MQRVFLLTSLLLCLFTRPAGARELLTALNARRTAAGLSPLVEDPVLNRTALLYSRELAARGELSHLDRSGNRVLQRYRNQGGTAVTVGEILGVGSEQSDVIAAWLASPEHRTVLLRADWTDCGTGSFPAGKVTIHVVLFAIQPARELQLTPVGEDWFLTGRMAHPKQGPPVIQTPGNELWPGKWDLASGDFCFTLPAGELPLCLRLGTLSPTGQFLPAHVIYPVREPRPPDPVPADKKD